MHATTARSTLAIAGDSADQNWPADRMRSLTCAAQAPPGVPSFISMKCSNTSASVEGAPRSRPLLRSGEASAASTACASCVLPEVASVDEASGSEGLAAGGATAAAGAAATGSAAGAGATVALKNAVACAAESPAVGVGDGGATGEGEGAAPAGAGSTGAAGAIACLSCGGSDEA